METTDRTPMEEARLRKGWTQRQLAAFVTAAGTAVNDSTISRIEKGLMRPRPGLRRALADALGLDAALLP